MIRKALDACAGNLSAVAAQLGITRQTLYNKNEKFRIMNRILPTSSQPILVQGITDGHLLSGDYLFGRASVLCLVQRQCLSADLKYHLASPALSPAHQAGALHDRCVGE